MDEKCYLINDVGSYILNVFYIPKIYLKFKIRPIKLPETKINDDTFVQYLIHTIFDYVQRKIYLSLKSQYSKNLTLFALQKFRPSELMNDQSTSFIPFGNQEGTTENDPK